MLLNKACPDLVDVLGRSWSTYLWPNSASQYFGKLQLELALHSEVSQYIVCPDSSLRHYPIVSYTCVDPACAPKNYRERYNKYRPPLVRVARCDNTLVHAVRPESPNLNYRLPTLAQGNRTCRPRKRDLPYTLTGLSQISHVFAFTDFAFPSSVCRSDDPVVPGGRSAVRDPFAIGILGR